MFIFSFSPAVSRFIFLSVVGIPLISTVPVDYRFDTAVLLWWHFSRGVCVCFYLFWCRNPARRLLVLGTQTLSALTVISYVQDQFRHQVSLQPLRPLFHIVNADFSVFSRSFQGTATFAAMKKDSATLQPPHRSVDRCLFCTLQATLFSLTCSIWFRCCTCQP